VSLPEVIGDEPVPLWGTAFFFDARRSTALIEMAGAAAAARVLRDLFAVAVPIVEDHGGTPVDFNGDGALALFTGTGSEGRAVRAAAEILRSVPGLRAAAALADGASFGVSVGVDSGDVQAVRIGTARHHAVAWVGRCTHTAAKLAKSAPVDAAAVTASVLARVRDVPLPGPLRWGEDALVEIGGGARKVRYLVAEP
jgi:class 3 adenylate cyclase